MAVMQCFVVFIISLLFWLSLSASVTTQQIITEEHIYPPLVPGSSETRLYFGLMMSFGGTLKSSGVIPGVQMALDIVNSNKNGPDDPLKGHSLHYILLDSQVSHS